MVEACVEGLTALMVQRDVLPKYGSQLEVRRQATDPEL